MQLLLDQFESPVGNVLLVTDEQDRLRAVDFNDYESRMHRLLRNHYGRVTLSTGRVPRALRDVFAAYFAGQFDALEEYPTATGGTAFQREVWQALRDIPPGTTITYGQLAGRVGRPSASRAVGAANGANPLAIIVPCHRVIGSSGALIGFGGGLPRKEWLLAHERHYSRTLLAT